MQSEIPEDVMKAAQDAFAKLADTYGSSAAMVFPIARAIMTERERHVSTILTGEMIEAAKSAYSECEFRTDEQVNSSITLIVRAALEAALSTDAEPVAWMRPANIETLKNGSSGAYSFQVSNSNFGGWTFPVYAHAEPVKTAPAVAVKDLEWREDIDGDFSVRSILGTYDVWRMNNDYVVYFRNGDKPLATCADAEKAKAAAQADYESRIRSALSAQVQDVAETLEAYYQRQIEWSRETFGPSLRTKGIIDHINKELREIEADPHDLSEWVDVVILAMDGFWRHGGNAEDLFKALIAKQKKNMARSWPDWRTMSEDSAIEHDRSKDAASPTEGRK